MDKLKEKFQITIEVLRSSEALTCAEITKEVSIEFAEWMLKYTFVADKRKWVGLEHDSPYYTTSELFDLFLQQNEI